jgi:hypothetical protein
VPAATPPAAASGADGGCLEDQNGRRWLLAEALRGPAVLLVGTPGVSAASTRWDTDLLSNLEHDPGIRVHRFLDLRGVPRLLAATVKARLRRSVTPPGTPVLLDWEGEVAASLRHDGTLPVLVVTSLEGAEVFRTGGGLDPRKAAALRCAVHQALGAARITVSP